MRLPLPWVTPGDYVLLLVPVSPLVSPLVSPSVSPLVSDEAKPAQSQPTPFNSCGETTPVSARLSSTLPAF